MRHHHRIDSGLNSLAERSQLDRIQPRPISGDLGHAEMRIGCGIAVAGKMLGGGHHSVGARAANVGGHKVAHLFRIFAKRAGVDNRIRRVGVDVGIREKIPMHADGAGFLGGDAAESLSRNPPFRPRQTPWRGETSWPRCRRMVTPRSKSAATSSGQLRLFLQTIEQFGGLVRFAAIEERRLPAHRHGK